MRTYLSGLCCVETNEAMPGPGMLMNVLTPDGETAHN
jgi:hypothetical protein